MARKSKKPDTSLDAEDDKIVSEAKKRFDRSLAWEGESNRRSKDDLRFANGDPDNGYQWPNDYLRRRQVADRPCLTINKIAFHNNLIINEGKKNKPGIKLVPTGGTATKQSADVYAGVIRHIEYKSNAQTVYDTAFETQVEGGVGYWRVLTKYVNDNSMDQEIWLARIRNPFTVYVDPNCVELNCSDARYALLYRDYERSQFDEDFPQYKDKGVPGPVIDNDGWNGNVYVRVAEYFRVVVVPDTLYVYKDAEGKVQSVRKSQITPALGAQLANEKDVRKRELKDRQVQWFKLVGNKVVERTVWAGKYIPIIKVVGRERVIDSILDRKGHTRMLKDAQRMYNYMASSQVEALGLQTKAPWVGPAKAIEGFENYWFRSNVDTPAYLPHNHMDDKGQPIPPPQRPQPPQASEGFQVGMQNAERDMMSASGQYEAVRGEPSNEQSGRAIARRQGQGETSTYNYIDNLMVGIQFTGMILIDLIPKIYDTRRIVGILLPDGETQQVTVDPDAEQPLTEQQKLTGEVERIFNPNVGEYEVQAEVGPAYATRRQETFDACVAIITQSPELMRVIGDLVFKNADFPGAEDIAERIKRTIPPEVLGQGPSPSEQQLQAQVKSLSQMLESAIQAAADATRKGEAYKYDKTVDEYRAETDRIKTLGPGMTPEAIVALVAQVLRDALQTDVTAPQQVQAESAQPPAGAQPEMPNMLMNGGGAPGGMPQ